MQHGLFLIMIIVCLQHLLLGTCREPTILADVTTSVSLVDRLTLNMSPTSICTPKWIYSHHYPFCVLPHVFLQEAQTVMYKQTNLNFTF